MNKKSTLFLRFPVSVKTWSVARRIRDDQATFEDSQMHLVKFNTAREVFFSKRRWKIFDLKFGKFNMTLFREIIKDKSFQTAEDEKKGDFEAEEVGRIINSRDFFSFNPKRVEICILIAKWFVSFKLFIFYLNKYWTLKNFDPESPGGCRIQQIPYDITYPARMGHYWY